MNEQKISKQESLRNAFCIKLVELSGVSSEYADAIWFSGPKDRVKTTHDAHIQAELTAQLIL